jgi:hypothetical protein
MKRHFLEDRVVFFQLDTLSRVLFILRGDITRRTRHAAGFVLGTLKDHLNSIAFLCHLIWEIDKFRGANIDKLVRKTK